MNSTLSTNNKQIPTNIFNWFQKQLKRVKNHHHLKDGLIDMLIILLFSDGFECDGKTWDDIDDEHEYRLKMTTLPTLDEIVQIVNSSKSRYIFIQCFSREQVFALESFHKNVPVNTFKKIFIPYTHHDIGLKKYPRATSLHFICILLGCICST